MNKEKVFKKWTAEEDNILLKYRPLFQTKSKWKEVSIKLFNGLRNPS